MKPTLKLKSFLILAEIDEYVQQYDIRGIELVQAPSDVCDGSYDRQELDELIRKKIFSICPHDEIPRGERKYYDSWNPPLCSHGWTVDFTPAAIKHFYPERENERTNTAHKRSVPRNRVRSGQKQVLRVRRTGTRCTSHNGKKAVSR